MKLLLTDDSGTVIDSWTRGLADVAGGEWNDATGDWCFMDAALPGDIQRQLFPSRHPRAARRA